MYTQQEDILIFGKQVSSFPNGIKEAFGDLITVLGSERAYYGISWFANNGNIVYYAMAPETFAGEANQYNCEFLTLPKGDYLTEPVTDWMSKTDSIKDVFHRIMGNSRPDKEHPCIEWYRSDDEMLCMVRRR